MSGKIEAYIKVEAARLEQVIELLELAPKLARAGIGEAGGRQGEAAGYEFKMTHPVLEDWFKLVEAVPNKEIVQ